MDLNSVPCGYFIEIHGGPTSSGLYHVSPSSDTIVSVYKSFNSTHDALQHIVECGRFVVSDLENKSTKEFFKEIRKGIIKIHFSQ